MQDRTELSCRSHLIQPCVTVHRNMSDWLPEGEMPGTSRPERMLAAAALIDQALICLRLHPDEAEMRLRGALQALGVRRRILMEAAQ